jgi:hypothetical protein
VWNACLTPNWLAFDGRDLPDRKHWGALVRRQGGQGPLAGQNPVPPRDDFPDAETFSFHPRGVNKYDDKSGFLVGTLYTTGSYVDYNDENDQNRFRRGREALAQKESFDPPFDREYVWKIPATQEQQERLYLAALEQRDRINSGDNTLGSYLLGTKNCGSWAEYMIESAGLAFPWEARLCNLGGTGVHGIADKSKAPAVVTETVEAGYDESQKVKNLPWTLDNLVKMLYGAPDAAGRRP